MNHTHMQAKTQTMPDHLASRSSNTHTGALSHTQTRCREGLKYARLGVSPRDSIFLPRNKLEHTQEDTPGGLGVASATELFTDGPRCGETL